MRLFFLLMKAENSHILWVKLAGFYRGTVGVVVYQNCQISYTEIEEWITVAGYITDIRTINLSKNCFRLA